eukprot:3731043-Pyramimonas_sp.AAC.1
MPNVWVEPYYKCTCFRLQAEELSGELNSRVIGWLDEVFTTDCTALVMWNNEDGSSGLDL